MVRALENCVVSRRGAGKPGAALLILTLSRLLTTVNAMNQVQCTAELVGVSSFIGLHAHVVWETFLTVIKYSNNEFYLYE